MLHTAIPEWLLFVPWPLVPWPLVPWPPVPWLLLWFIDAMEWLWGIIVLLCIIFLKMRHSIHNAENGMQSHYKSLTKFNIWLIIGKYTLVMVMIYLILVSIIVAVHQAPPHSNEHWSNSMDYLIFLMISNGPWRRGCR